MERLKPNAEREVSFNLDNVKEGTVEERDNSNSLRRKSREIRRPSVTLSREFSTTSTGSYRDYQGLVKALQLIFNLRLAR